MKLPIRNRFRLADILLIGCFVAATGIAIVDLDVGTAFHSALLYGGIALAAFAVTKSGYNVVRELLTRKDMRLSSYEEEAETTTSRVGLYPVPWSASDALALTLVAFLGGQLVGVGAVSLYIASSEGIGLLDALGRVEGGITSLFIGYLFAQIIAIGFVYLFVWYRRGSLAALGFRSFKFSKAVGLMAMFFVGYLIISSVTVIGLEAVDTGIDFQAQQEIGFLEASTTLEVLLAFIALVVLAPFAEELVFRGVLLPAFSKKLGLTAAVILTSILFGILHPPVNAMIGIGVFAVFLALIYAFTRSIWPAIMLHSLKNLLAFIAIFFADELLEYAEQIGYIFGAGGVL